jgi:hypothetical protein
MRLFLALLLALMTLPAQAQQQTIELDISGGVLGFSLGTSPTTLSGIPPSTKSITFTNPGAVAVYVCPSLDMTGNPLTPGPNPGNTVVAPGTVVVFTGTGVRESQWLAATATGSDVPFTVVVSPNQ